MEEVAGGLSKPFNEELNDLYSLLGIRVIRQRRIRWVGHVAQKGEKKMHAGFWSSNIKERAHLKDQVLDIGEILRTMLGIISRSSCKKWFKKIGDLTYTNIIYLLCNVVYC
jgi:hypothetical protein